MNLDIQKKQKDPVDKDIKFILELFNSKKFLETKKEIDKQILNFPDSPILLNILGAVLAELGEINEAIKNYKKAIAINPDYAQAYNNLGVAFYRLKRKDYAIDNYKKAIKLKGNFFQAISNLGGVMKNIGKLQDAIIFFKEAIKINPDYAEAYYNLGDAYDELFDKKKAETNLKKSIEINPNLTDAYNALGNLFFEQTKFSEAQENYEKAISINPKHEKSLNNLGILLSTLGRFDEAETLFRQAIKHKPNYEKAYSNMLLNLNYKTNFDNKSYLKEAKNFRSNCFTENKIKIQYKYKANPSKLRVGLISADFGNHPGGYFTLDTLKELKKKDIELIAYSNFERKDEFASYFKPLFFKWNSIAYKDDTEVVSEIINDGIHILIDLQGHSSKNRLPIFFHKSAPIQVTWLGQGSTGIKEIDYFVGSNYITPKNEEKNYVEKVFRIPNISQSFARPNFDLEIKNLPALKNNFITFGSINKLCKINDKVILLWSKILLSIPKSILILKSRELSDRQVLENTLTKFKKLNVGADRVMLIGKSSTRKEVMEIYNRIDIALDPFPFQGNTSTCEAVWMGVPVLTLKGNRYLFHFGESINSNLGMSDWIAKDNKEYIEKAIKFSSDLKKLTEIRLNLRQIALNSPVFNCKTFSNDFHEMLWKMWNDFNNK